MAEIIDHNFLREHQYRDANNLKKRMGLHELYSTNPLGWFHFVREHLDLPQNARILEVGGGPATLWVSQASHVPQSWTVTVSDFSPGMVAQARESLSQAGQSFRFAVLDAQVLPFPDASFDGIVANHMLYHVPDRQRALAEFRRILRQEGTLFAATNGQTHLHELHEWIARAASRMDQAVDGMLWGATLPFNLENGRQQLLEQFNSVELFLYPDALEVTQVEPLLQYAQSMLGRAHPGLGEVLLRHLREIWTEEIRTRGSVHISKSTGLFVAK